MLIIVSFESYRFFNEKNAMELKLAELSQTYSLLLAEPLSAGDDRGLRLVTAGLIVDTDVEAYVIRDSGRRIVDSYGLTAASSVDARGEGQVLATVYRQPAFGILNLHSVTSIQYAGEGGAIEIGELELRLSPRQIYTLLKTDLLMSLFMLAVFATVVLITTRSAYNFFIGGRLRALLDDIRNVENTLDHQVVSSGNTDDELALIIEAYNEAHRGRLAYQQEVNDYQNSLEQQVADRTLDLQRELDEHAITSQQLFLEKQRVDVTLNSIKDAVFNIDADGRVVLANPACEQLLGIGQLAFLGRNILDLLPHEDTDKLSLVQDIEVFIANGHIPHKTHEIYLRSQNDELINAEVSLVPFVDDAEKSPGMAVFIRDVTLQYQMTEKLTYEAKHDALTGLVNRREFEKRLGNINSTLRKNEAQNVLCFLDLDYFKTVNDTAGHQAGDQVLKDIAAGLNRFLRTTDTLARLGGDEFGVILTACDLASATRICELMCTFVADYRFASGGVDFIFGVSIGVVCFEPGVFTSDELIKRADKACYVAKAEGRNKVCFDCREGH